MTLSCEVRKQIEDMLLNLNDETHYSKIDQATAKIVELVEQATNKGVYIDANGNSFNSMSELRRKYLEYEQQALRYKTALEAIKTRTRGFGTSLDNEIHEICKTSLKDGGNLPTPSDCECKECVAKNFPVDKR